MITFKGIYFCVLVAHILSVDAAGAIKRDDTAGNLIQYRRGDILIAGLIPVHNRENEICSSIQEDGIQAVETINMIIDKINNDKTILRGIKLGTILIDTCDSDSHAVKRVVLDILPLMLNREAEPPESTTRRPKIPPSLVAGVVGASSSAVSIQVANILQAFMVPQVSYWSTSPKLSNKERYKYFFRVVPSDLNQANAIMALVTQRQWNYISVVYEDDFYGVHGFQEIKNLANKRGVCIAVFLPVPRSPTQEDFRKIINKLIEKNAKAVILFTKTNDASNLLLAAQKVGGEAKNLVWIGTDGWTAQIPLESSEFDDPILDSSIGFNPKTEMLKNFQDYFLQITPAKRTKNFRNPWFREYIEKTNNCSFSNGSGIHRICSLNESVDRSNFHGLEILENVADSVLAFVHALDKYHVKTCKGAPGMCEAISRHVGSTRLASEVYSYLKDISFTNLNGRNLSFDENQDGPAVYDVYTYKANKENRVGSSRQNWMKIGKYENGDIKWTSPLQDKVYNTESVCSKPCKPGMAKKIETEICCWHCEQCASYEYVSGNGTSCSKCPPGHKPNVDQTVCVPLQITEISYHSTYGIICSCIATLGLVCTSIITCIYAVNRNTAIVKASGNELCFFIICGIFISFINFLPMMASPTRTSCIMSRVILALGPACVYAGLLMKTIRVVIIFQSKSTLSPKMRIFVRKWPQIFSTLALVLVQIFVLLVWFMVNGPKVVVHYPVDDVAFRACVQLVDLPILVALIYPFLLIIICTVLATKNRNIPTAFNETRYIGFSVYTTCVIWLAFLPIFISNTADLAQRIMITSVCLSLSAFTVLICLFAPRCVTILFRPERNTRKSIMSAGRSFNTRSEPKFVSK